MSEQTKKDSCESPGIQIILLVNYTAQVADLVLIKISAFTGPFRNHFNVFMHHKYEPYPGFTHTLCISLPHISVQSKHTTSVSQGTR